MKLLIDTNVIMDFLLAREPFGPAAREVVRLAEEDKTIEFVSASAVTDIFYSIERAFRKEDPNGESSKREKSARTQNMIRDLCTLISILPVTPKDIDYALELNWQDFEDAVQYAVAVSNDMDYIISRNGSDYEVQKIPVVSPSEFLQIYSEAK